ncbi:ankyrin repeat-containing domain protein [Aspergillus karnatakaensis]|uniref:ankyrin repeat domain-containing protein n=1 Tax=Aspergillus karnatakaensis TaxID=1810916 RepID=UPI003CCD6037
MALVRLLLKHKAAPNARNHKGQTALFLAAKDNHDGIVQLLLEAKASVNVRDLDGATPMSLACALGQSGARIQTFLGPLSNKHYDMSPDTTDHSDNSDWDESRTHQEWLYPSISYASVLIC